MDANAGRASGKAHVSLYVSALERSVAFYQALFGTPAHRARPGYAEFDIGEPPLRLALNECATSRGGAVNHLGALFGSPAQLQAVGARLQAAGIPLQDIPESRCRLAGCAPRYDTIWVHDPDGNRWELYAEIPDTGGYRPTPEEDEPK